MPDLSRHASGLLRSVIVVTIGLAVLACDSVAFAPTGPVPSPTHVLSASPAATPHPSAAPVGRQYILALVAAFESDPLITHMAQTGKLTSGKFTANVTLNLDLSGRDMRFTTTTKALGKTSKQSLVLVGKSVYVRIGNLPWRKLPRSVVEKHTGDLVTALRLIRDPADLKYVGAETIDGHKRQHLTASRILPYQAATGEVGQYDKFDIWVAEDGRPVLARVAFRVTGVSGEQIKGTSEFRFSHFGGPIKIVAPKVAR
jgi:hypothetical protein